MKKRAALYVLLFPRHTITRDRKDTEGVNGTNHLTSCRGETETGWPVWAQNSRRIHRKRAAAAAAMGWSWAPHPPKASTTSRPRSRASPDGAGGRTADRAQSTSDDRTGDRRSRSTLLFSEVYTPGTDTPSKPNSRCGLRPGRRHRAHAPATPERALHLLCSNCFPGRVPWPTATEDLRSGSLGFARTWQC